MKNKLVSLFLLLGIIGGCFAASAAEISALSDLFESAGGINWFHSTNWGQGDPCTNSWYGVTCNNSAVTGLRLNTNNLNGYIPSSISSLSALTSLQLSSNYLSRELTTSIGYLSKLNTLDLSHNYHVGHIPASLNNIIATKVLQYLDFSYNKFSGPIPSFLNAQFKSLKLSHNPFSCPVPSWATESGATCETVSLKSVTPTGTRSGSVVLVVTSGIKQEDTVTCYYPSQSQTFNATFLTTNLFSCPTPVLSSANSICTSPVSVSLTLGVNSQSIQGSASIPMYYTDCYPTPFTVSGTLQSNAAKTSQFCLNGICQTSWSFSGSSGGSSVSFSKCSSRATPTSVPNTRPAGQWWYHTWSGSDCSPQVPTNPGCMAGLNTIVDCATNAYYGDWRSLNPGETHNAAPGPGIYWWCWQGCSNRQFPRAIHYICPT